MIFKYRKNKDQLQVGFTIGKHRHTLGSEFHYHIWIELGKRYIEFTFKDNDYNQLINYLSNKKARKILETSDRDYPSRFIFRLLLNEPRILCFLPSSTIFPFKKPIAIGMAWLSIRY